nr:synaptic vesicle glycoprotein 2B isoform X1 [Helicoverpa armigera]
MAEKGTYITTRVPYEEALDRAGFSRYNIWIFAICASITFTTTFEVNSGPYIATGSACELNTTVKQQGLFESIPTLGVFMTMHLWGYLADTRGRQRMLTINLFMSFITGIIATFSTHWIVLLVLKCIASAVVGAAMMTSLTLLSECTPTKHRSTLIILTSSAYLVACALMAAIARVILPLEFSFYVPILGIYFNSWRLLNLIFAVPSAISAVLCMQTYESPKYLLCAGRDEDALDVLKKIYTMNNRNDADYYKVIGLLSNRVPHFQVESLELEEVQIDQSNKGFFKSVIERTLPMVKVPVRRYFHVLSGLYTVTYATMAAFFATTPFILDAIVKSAGSEKRLSICDMIRSSINNTSVLQRSEDCPLDTGALIPVFGITMILAIYNVVMGIMTYRISRKTLFIGMQLVAGLAGLLINTSYLWVLSSILFTVFISAIVNISFLNSYSVEVFPTYYKASAVCLLPLGGRGNASMAIKLIARLLNNNCELAFYIFGGIAFAGGFIAFLLPSEQTMKEHRQKLKPVASQE